MSVAPAAAERRRAPRRQPALGTILRLPAELDGGETRMGLVWNISLGGISMLFNEPVEAGAVLRGELLTERCTPVPVILHVNHVSQLATGDYALGCQFERPLAPEQLRPFVADPPPRG